jgi:hypothetical protein
MKARIVGRESLSSEQGIIADKILDWLDEWTQTMGLDRWQLTFAFVPTLKEGETEDDLQTCADTMTEWFYQVLKVTFYARGLNPAKVTDEDAERIVVHELSHSLVQPMEAEGISDREYERVELVVTSLERAFMNSKYKQAA